MGAWGVKDLNGPLCSFIKLYDRELECYLTQGKKQKFKPPDGFTGVFDPSNGDMIPLFREADGFWYMYLAMFMDMRAWSVAQRASSSAKNTSSLSIISLLAAPHADSNLGCSVSASTSRRSEACLLCSDLSQTVKIRSKKKHAWRGRGGQ